jgi:hypothetical protein
MSYLVVFMANGQKSILIGQWISEINQPVPQNTKFMADRTLYTLNTAVLLSLKFPQSAAVD